MRNQKVSSSSIQHYQIQMILKCSAVLLSLMMSQYVSAFSHSDILVVRTKPQVMVPVDLRNTMVGPNLGTSYSKTIRKVIRFKDSSLNDTPKNLPDSDKNNSSKSRNIRERMLKLSNVASLLCVMDCTVLPLVTVLLPLLGLGAATTSYAGLSNAMHDIGHQMALYFVLPVGGFAMIMNYLNHQRKLLLALSSLGMGMVYMANAGHHSPIFAFLPHKLAHEITCGTVLHRIVNIIGCGFLLWSNYLGKKTPSCIAHKHGCQHDHV